MKIAWRGVVIHSSRSGKPLTDAQEFTATVNHLSNVESGVSAHMVIGRQSGLAYPIPTSRVAYHAREPSNSTHLSIELVQQTKDVLFTPFQYEQAARQCVLWAIEFNFPLNVDKNPIQGIIGHEFLSAGMLDGKSDPGPMFDWKLFERQIKENLLHVVWTCAERFAGEEQWLSTGLKSTVALFKETGSLQK